ncbi:molybdenum cofactor biosynthesis protein MoaE [Glutamicibacter uratoxydans]|uniref:molybdenum cofactor biosynthesis protein MoaE n=1 Tax=Glutamicibacter uratoxydans TaxID=43667 RepID=UPI003D6E6B38
MSYALITEEIIDEQAVRDAVQSDTSGALVMFHGIIRNHDGGQSVNSLDYSHHPQAQEFLAKIIAEEEERTGLKLAAVHRVGPLQIGDAALVAAAAAAHRKEAFQAIENLVERIKAEVPIWKKQHFTSGSSEWVGL